MIRTCALCRINPVSECDGWPSPPLYCGSCMSFADMRVKRNAGKPPDASNPAIQYGVRQLLATLPPAELATARRSAQAGTRRAQFTTILGGAPRDS